MKAMPVKYDPERYEYVQVPKEEATHLKLKMQGAFPNQTIPIYLPGGPKLTTPQWEWNGDTEKPTLSPSINTWCDLPNGTQRCHCFVRDGMVQHLGDCTHEYVGQTLPLLEVDSRN